MDARSLFFIGMKLNPLLLATTLLSLNHATSLAQCPSNRGQIEFFGSYGLGTASQVFITTNSVQNTIPGRKVNVSDGGVLFAGARYFMSRAVAIGLVYGATTTKGQYAPLFSSSITGDYSIRYQTVALEMYYIYGFSKYIETYSTLGCGPTFVTATASDPVIPEKSLDKLTVHYCPIGVRVGGRIAGFAEIGIGHKGLINMGLSAKLGPSCWWKYR